MGVLRKVTHQCRAEGFEYGTFELVEKRAARCIAARLTGNVQVERALIARLRTVQLGNLIATDTEQALVREHTPRRRYIKVW